MACGGYACATHALGEFKRKHGCDIGVGDAFSKQK